MQMIHIYKDVGRIQIGIEEDQIKSYNIIYSPTKSDHNYMKSTFSNATHTYFNQKKKKFKIKNHALLLIGKKEGKGEDHC